MRSTSIEASNLLVRALTPGIPGGSLDLSYQSGNGGRSSAVARRTRARIMVSFILLHLIA